ncbi:OmpA family protein [Atlantibacter sp.]|uniref:OmpA/MotB family protein n=1 Tax=Atlantibacter sp. TaxID=1903473 RepID=UPI0013EFA3B2|nr:OmpA family protein [Atlantibacter sp.]
MKDKPNEWVSISDLMAGVMAVVMLMLVLSVLQNKVAEVKREQEKNSGLAAQQQKLNALMHGMQKEMTEQGEEALVGFDIASGKITLRDKIFARGSACITEQAKDALARLAPRIQEFVTSSTNTQVFVEGHTDNLAVSNPVVDQARFCTVYDDNYTLSAARAREARKLLVAKLNDQQSHRVIVAGFGDSQPLRGISPSDERNRRVEVQFLTHAVSRTEQAAGSE